MKSQEIAEGDIVLGLKQLFGIPDRFAGKVVNKGEYFNLKDQLVPKDDPESGVDLLRLTAEKRPEFRWLDLSYSFPLVKDIGLFSQLVIHPAASLGVPVNVVVMYSDSPVSSNLTEHGLRESNVDTSFALLHAVLNDLKNKGMEVLVRESNYKAVMINQLFEDCIHLSPTAEKNIRSRTMLSASCEPGFLLKIQQLGYEVQSKETGGIASFTIANYPTLSKEATELLADRIMAL